VSRVQTEAELEAVRRSEARGQPFGSETWQKQTARALDLEYTFRKQGRPRKLAQPFTRYENEPRPPRPLFSHTGVPVAHGVAQFSTCNPGTALKSPSLVTTVQLPKANAIAASCISTICMTRPTRRSSW
jgi:hypothetical protein